MGANNLAGPYLGVPPHARLLTVARQLLVHDRTELKTYPVLVFRALRLYVCLLLLRVVEARVLLRELRLVAIGFEQVVDVAS